MADRITDAHLKTMCEVLNKMTGQPLEAYSLKEAGASYTANIGCYHIDFTYGGVMLAQISNATGGITHPCGEGILTKRALYNQMRAFIRGIEVGKALQVNGDQS